ncbi:glycosyl transferase [Gryllotalpicola daejeonensis]|uniref:glycosyl transferase n=1 Tax=Gryllotalpicola daejeonensis TaxID=993087 RepID=UPI0031D57B89
MAWGYPPSRGSGVYRAWATANAFAERGWRVTVLTADRETFALTTGTDTSLEARINPSVQVVRVPFPAPGFRNDVRKWSRLRAEAPELWNGFYEWRGQRMFPERVYGGWRRALEHAAREIHAANPVNLTIGTANPNVDFIPGFVLHEAFGVPYVMDYRDAWQLDVFSGNRITAESSAVDRWEKRLVAGASEVWFVNEPILRWHAEVYPEHASKLRVVSNGYDFAPIAVPRTDRLPKASLVFGYVGTISAAVPIREIIDGWALARKRSALVRASRLELYGHLSHTATANSDFEAQRERFKTHAISHGGSLQKSAVSAKYSEFDALVLMAGAGRYVTGGKVYEYAATGLPIASVHDPANDTSSALAQYPWWRGSARADAESYAATFIEVAELAAAQTEEQRAAAREWARRFEREAQLAPRIDGLAELIGAVGTEEATS